MRLNLGCSDDLRSGFVNVDIAPPADVLTDLNQPWPWEDSTIESIIANDVLEHLHSKIWAMNEAHRVLQPGGAITFMVPCVHLLDGRVNPGAFCDPTHHSFWTLDDQYYWATKWNNPQGERGRLGPAYGITGLFEIERWELFDYGSGNERRSKLIGKWVAVK